MKMINEDITDIIADMESIRRENLVRKINNEKKNEYLHLSGILADQLKAVEDKKTLDRINSVVRAIDENPVLLSYDFMQEDFWRETHPELSKELDKILIAVKKDDFTSLREKHHIVSAVKYLSTENKERKTKIRTYDFILPFNNGFSSSDKNDFLEFLESSGKIKDIEISGNTLKVTKANNLETLIEVASYMGFNRLQTIVEGHLHKELKEEYGEESVGPLRKEPWIKANKESKIVDVLANIVKYTKPISYTLLGALPSSLQRRTAKRFNESKVENAYDPIAAYITNNWIETIAILSAGIVLSNWSGSNEFMCNAFDNIGFFDYDLSLRSCLLDSEYREGWENFKGWIAGGGWLWIPVTMLALVQLATRFADSMRYSNESERPTGDLLTKLPFLYLEKLLDKKYGKLVEYPFLFDLGLSPVKAPNKINLGEKEGTIIVYT